MDAIKEEDLESLETQIYEDAVGPEDGNRPDTARSTTSSGSERSTLSGESSVNDQSSQASDENTEVLFNVEDKVYMSDESPVIFVDEDPYIENPPKGCWHSFVKCLCSFWLTREIRPKHDQNFHIRTTIRELVLYAQFLVLLSFLTFGMTSATMFYYTQIIMGLFSNQTQVQVVGDFWNFLQNDLMDGLYWEDTSDDGNGNMYICPSGNESAGRCPISANDKIIFYGNFMIGVPRLRQLRVLNNSCIIHPLMQATLRTKTCYRGYSESFEDTSGYGLAASYYTSGASFDTSINAWTYNSSSALNGTSYKGIYATYSGAGSIQDLDSIKNKSSAIISELMEGLWITRGTRFVSLDVTLYNPNLNLFCIIKMVFEFPETGGVFSSATYSTVKLMPYVTAYDYFIMACQVVFVVFIGYYIIEEGLEISKKKLEYFKSVFNWLDIFVIGISVIAIIIQIYLMLLTNANIDVMLGEPDTFADFTFLASWAMIYNNVIAVLVLLAWLKVFKYITFNRTMKQLKTTLDRCKRELVGFFLMFLIVFFAFDVMAYVWFEAQAQSYNTLVETTFTLMRIILADFDFVQLKAADPFLGPFFFFVYVFFVFIILINVFLAIVNDTYHWVYLDLLEQKKDYQVEDYIKEASILVVDRVLSRERAVLIEEAVNMAAADGQVTYEEIRQNLKKCNFSDVEIEVFYSSHDLDGVFTYNPDEKLEDEKISRPGIENLNGPVNLEFTTLTNRVDSIEQSISTILPKLDKLLYKIISSEGENMKRKATMAKVLGVITEDDDNFFQVDDESKRRQVEEMIRSS